MIRNDVMKYMFRLIVAGLGFYLIVTGFMKWPDILVDYGRELYVPWQVSEGKILYHDIAWFNGPVSVYTHALMFKLFGVHINTLVGFNLLLTACFTCVLYAFFKRICDELTAFACTLTFIGVFAFNQFTYTGNYNFVCPYSYEITHAIVYSIGALYCFYKFFRSEQNRVLLFSGFLTGLTFLSKPEVFISLLAAIITGLLLWFWHRGIKRTGWTGIWVLSGFFMPLAVFSLLISQKMPYSQALFYLLSPYKAILNQSIRANVFYTVMQGFDNPFRNMITMVVTVCIYIAIVGLLLILTRISVGTSRRRYTIQAVVAGLALLCLPLLGKQGIWNRSLRGLPLMGILLCIIIFFELVRRKQPASSLSGRLALLQFGVFSVVLTAKIILNVNVILYGFALAMPLTLFVIAVLFKQIPFSAARTPEFRRLYRYFAFLLIALFIGVHVSKAVRVYDMKNYRLTWNSETLWDFNLRGFQRGIFVNETLKQIELLMPANATFVVFPEGIMLNYLSRRINPTSYINFMPIELMVFKEETILASLAASPPDFVIFVDKRTTEYGFDYFGTDYGKRISDWLREHYVPVWSIGGRPLSGEGFGIQILGNK